jgi:hypothetical protein
MAGEFSALTGVVTVHSITIPRQQSNADLLVRAPGIHAPIVRAIRVSNKKLPSRDESFSQILSALPVRPGYAGPKF